MRLIIFGATGTIGRQLVEQALQQGHSVTAFARHTAKLDDLRHPNLTLKNGDVLDYDAVQSAVQNHDAVLCALGAGRQGVVRAEGTRHIVRAMEQNNIRRLICQTTLGVGNSQGNLNFFWKNIMFGWFLKAAFLDHEQQEKYVQESNVDWTIVRPAAFTDGPKTGQYRHGFSADAEGLKLKISRADVASFMLQQLNSEQYLRKTPGLSY